jgi:hypothetical protein
MTLSLAIWENRDDTRKHARLSPITTKFPSEAITRHADAPLDVAQGVIDHLFDLRVRFASRRQPMNRAAESADEVALRRHGGLGPTF